MGPCSSRQPSYVGLLLVSFDSNRWSRIENQLPKNIETILLRDKASSIAAVCPHTGFARGISCEVDIQTEVAVRFL